MLNFDSAFYADNNANNDEEKLWKLKVWKFFNI